MITRPTPQEIPAPALPVALFRNRRLGRAFHAGRAIVAERYEKAAKLGAIFKIHADHFEAGLMGTHEPNHSAHADGAEASGNLQGRFWADGYLYIAAEEAALEAEDADGGRIFSAGRSDHGGDVARQPHAAI